MLSRVRLVSILLPLGTRRFLAIGAEGQTRAYPFGRNLELRATIVYLFLLGGGFKVYGFGCWNVVVLGDCGFRMMEGVVRSVMAIVFE
jgi:hypothetical protein